MSGDFLQQMAHASRQRVESARAGCPEAQLRSQALACAPVTPLRLSAEGFDLIAECKLRSPAVGVLRSLDPHTELEQLGQRVLDYAAAGAAAVSVLTEPSRFDGHLSHLAAAARALQGRAPVMRKDFLVDPYQLYEARVAGASGALLIVRMLSRSQLQAMLQVCAELGLFALLEAFDEADLTLAAELVSAHRTHVHLLVGVNCRDLATLQVVPGRLEALAPRLPPGVPHVAESGLTSAADAACLAAAGYELALVGSALMRAPDARALAHELLSAGREAAPRRSSGTHHVDQDLRAYGR
jgi:indole-3-glycerol phosphate synthase